MVHHMWEKNNLSHLKHFETMVQMGMYYVHVLMAPVLWKLQSAHQKIQGLLLHKQASAAGIKLT